MIYLDNAATTRLDNRVFEAMLPYYIDLYGNAGSIYQLGRKSADAIKAAREQVAKFLNAEPEQIIFTSGGTEGNNMVFRLAAQYMRVHQKDNVVVSSYEHKSVLRSAESLCDEYCYDLAYLRPTTDGVIPISLVTNSVTGRTGIVSVMYMNNEIGSINKTVKQMAEACHRVGSLFHTDCVQIAGSHRIDVKDIDCDFATISSHKIHGPKGVGAIYIKDPKIFDPMILGGYEQEFGLRGGTENVAGIVGFGKACELCTGEFAPQAGYYRQLTQTFFASMCEELVHRGLCGLVSVNSQLAGHKSANYLVRGVDAETLVLLADSMGVCISAGSACNSHDNVPSHVLKAIGLTDDEARSSFRVSVSRMNTIEEMREAGKIIADCIATLKGI